ncbi:MAG: hypothetical protein A4E65_01043 [Syntrophorhabdus sp. PtaU1.Bin153]|nr:MAG: hypothetical protein A4E65_01043 [Syntrophorhabdus sp. PtaU1.Bin153]
MDSVARSHAAKKKNVTTSNGGYEGICTSCDNVALCTFIQGSRQPVIFCEEFASNGIPVTARTAEIEQSPSQGNAYPEEQKGLCATCESSGSCVFPKDEAGIWHCEEYR